jgi:hypothetical protein
MLVVIIAFSMFAPANDDTDLSPTTYNSGSAGTKAAYLLLGELGYGARRWEASPDDLKNVDAAKTTLVLAEPNFPTEGSKQVQAEIADFLSPPADMYWRQERRCWPWPWQERARPGLSEAMFSETERTEPPGSNGKVSLVNVHWAALGPGIRVSVV